MAASVVMGAALAVGTGDGATVSLIPCESPAVLATWSAQGGLGPRPFAERPAGSIVRVRGSEPAPAIAPAIVPASAHAVASPTAPVMANALWQACGVK